MQAGFHTVLDQDARYSAKYRTTDGNAHTPHQLAVILELRFGERSRGDDDSVETLAVDHRRKLPRSAQDRKPSARKKPSICGFGSFGNNQSMKRCAAAKRAAHELHNVRPRTEKSDPRPRSPSPFDPIRGDNRYGQGYGEADKAYRSEENNERSREFDPELAGEKRHDYCKRAYDKSRLSDTQKRCDHRTVAAFTVGIQPDRRQYPQQQQR